MEKWAGKGRTQRCLEAAGQPGKSNRQKRKWAGVCTSCSCLLLIQTEWESPGRTRQCLHPFRNKTTSTLPSVACLQRIFLFNCTWGFFYTSSRRCCFFPLALWLLQSFDLRVTSHVVFNGTSACAWINWVQTNMNILSWDCSLKKYAQARFLAACNFTLLFEQCTLTGWSELRA